MPDSYFSIDSSSRSFPPSSAFPASSPCDLMFSNVVYLSPFSCLDLPLLYTGNTLAGAEARDDPVPGLRLRRVLEDLLGRLEPRDRIAAPEDRDGRERLERRRRLAEARLG